MSARQWFTAAIAAGVAATAVPVHQAQADDHDEINITVEDVPDALTHQGRLIDDEGQPISGEVELTYTLWDHPTEGAVVWQDVVDVEVDETGFYSVELGGEANPIDASVVADGQGWLGVSVDGGDELEPRISLNAVPYTLVAEEALRAGEAEFAEEALVAGQADVALSVEEGSIGAEALADDFQVEPEHIEEVTGETLGGLTCANGEIARFDSDGWSCDDTVARAASADEADHAATADHADEATTADHADEADHADGADQAGVAAGVEAGSIGSDALSATFSVTPNQIDGDTLGGLFCANGDIARFDGNNWYCDDITSELVTEVTADGPLTSSGGNEPTIGIDRADETTDGYLHAEDFASFDERIEQVDEGEGIFITGSDASPEVNVEFGDQPGTVVEGDDPRLSDARDPLAGSDDYIQADPAFAQDVSLAIDGTAEVGSIEFGAGYGESAADPGDSCYDILVNNSAAYENDGYYFVDIDGSTTEVFCDMTRDGGGWTLIAGATDEGDDDWTWNNRDYFTTDTTTFGDVASDFDSGTRTLSENYKNMGLHELEMQDVKMEVSGDNDTRWGSYRGVGTEHETIADVIDSHPLGAGHHINPGYEMSAGTFRAFHGESYGLCSTHLYFNLSDCDGTCSNTGTDDQDTYGPTWSTAGNSASCGNYYTSSGVTTDEPAATSFGVYRQSGYTDTQVDWGYLHFTAPDGRERGLLPEDEGYSRQMYVR